MFRARWDALESPDEIFDPFAIILAIRSVGGTEAESPHLILQNTENLDPFHLSNENGRLPGILVSVQPHQGHCANLSWDIIPPTPLAAGRPGLMRRDRGAHGRSLRRTIGLDAGRGGTGATLLIYLVGRVGEPDEIVPIS